MNTFTPGVLRMSTMWPGMVASAESRLVSVANALSVKCSHQLSVIQVWSSLVGYNRIDVSNYNNVVLVPSYQLCGLPDERLAEFFEHSRRNGITGSEIALMSKVWSRGALQLVQNVSVIPETVHPRTKLEGQAAEAVAEAAYIPVYDLLNPIPYVFAVVEVMVSADSQDSMAVANVISIISELLIAMKLSISQPVPVSQVNSGFQSFPCPSQVPQAAKPQQQGVNQPNYGDSPSAGSSSDNLSGDRSMKDSSSSSLSRTTSVRVLHSLDSL